MSSYLNFYMANKENEQYVRINSFSRNNAIYTAFCENGAPYDAGVELKQLYNMVKTDLEDSKKRYEKHILENENEIKILAEMKGSLEERLNNIREDHNEIIECKEEIEDIKYLLNFLEFLVEMDCESGWQWSVMCGIEWNPNYKEEE